MRQTSVYKMFIMAVITLACLTLLAGCQTGKSETATEPGIPKGYFDNITPNIGTADLAYQRDDYETAFKHYSLMAENGSTKVQSRLG